MDLLKAAALGVVEGLTEFIPVSSTGHLILAGRWMGEVGPRADLFVVLIQLGAILAVVWHYRRRFLACLPWTVTTPCQAADGRRLLVLLFLATLPVVLIGLFTHRWVLDHLFRPVIVAWSLVAGGIGMLATERWRRPPVVYLAGHLSGAASVGIGLSQVIALVPGVSRSAATICGAMALGVARPAAVEFSFLLAVPAIVGASALELHTHRALLHLSDLPVYLVGIGTAFVSAKVAIRLFLKMASGHNLSGFAWYRIALGVIVLCGLWCG